MRSILINFLILGSSLGLKVVSTDQDQARPDIDGYVEIINSSLKGYDEFTLCGRFLVYYFPRIPGEEEYQIILSVGKRFLLSSYGASPCEDLYPGCTDYKKFRLGAAWRHKKVFGFSNFGSASSFSYFPSWQPGVWTSVCVTASKSQADLRVRINGVTVARSETYNGFYQDTDKNLILMNNFYWGKYPSHGAITDIHIWGRVLSDQETEDWALCKTAELEGEVSAWGTAELRIVGLFSSEHERNETCPTESTGYRGFNITRDFEDGEQFCRNIGGTLAVGRDLESLEQISKVFQQNCRPALELFYTGFTDRQLAGQWVHSVTGESTMVQITYTKS